jgi:Zn-dependent metalloprotease
MKDPGSAFDDPVLGKDPQPAHMNDFVDTYEDNGGVHINSGIPNKAFYLAATKLGGYAWERAGRIWYDALRDSAIRPNTGFRRFARVTIAHAAAMGAVEADAVREAWAEVGISVAAPALAPLTMRAGTGATRG